MKKLIYAPRDDGSYFAPELKPGATIEVPAERAKDLLETGQFTEVGASAPAAKKPALEAK